MNIHNFYDPADYPMTIRSQFERMSADVEFDRIDKDDLLNQLEELQREADDQVELAIRASDEMEKLEDATGGLDTFIARVELVIRELEWTEPDNETVLDLRTALRGFHNGEELMFA